MNVFLCKQTKGTTNFILSRRILAVESFGRQVSLQVSVCTCYFLVIVIAAVISRCRQSW